VPRFTAGSISEKTVSPSSVSGSLNAESFRAFPCGAFVTAERESVAIEWFGTVPAGPDPDATSVAFSSGVGTETPVGRRVPGGTDVAISTNEKFSRENVVVCVPDAGVVVELKVGPPWVLTAPRSVRVLNSPPATGNVATPLDVKVAGPLAETIQPGSRAPPGPLSEPAS
jgi:hypothetical protein